MNRPDPTTARRIARAAWGRVLEWRHWAPALAGVHGAIAWGEALRGLNFSVDARHCTWDWFWQVIPTVDLMQRPWQSLWLDHAQPPGFSLWGWAWLRVCGAGHFPASMQVGYVLLGAAVVGLTYKLARALSGSAGVALAAGAGMALNPALFYFESYILYEPLVIFLLTASAWALWRALAAGSRPENQKQNRVHAAGVGKCRTAPRFRAYGGLLPWVGFKTEANPRLSTSNPSGVPEEMGRAGKGKPAGIPDGLVAQQVWIEESSTSTKRDSPQSHVAGAAGGSGASGASGDSDDMREAGGSGRWLFVYFALINILVLTRSLYHLVFILGALGPAWPILRAMRWRRRLAVALLAVALPAGWYGKNLAQYGFFGASSWYGFGLYKCVETQYPILEIRALIGRGELPAEIADGSVYDRALSYYRKYGYARSSAVPLLGRDDFHNINVPALSKTFYAAAKRLILRDPWRYLQAVHLSYRRFCRPPSCFAQLRTQHDAFIGWEPLVANWLYGQWVTDAIEIPTHCDLGSLFYFYFPLLMGGGAWWAVRRGMGNGEDRATECGMRSRRPTGPSHLECGMGKKSYAKDRKEAAKDRKEMRNAGRPAEGGAPERIAGWKACATEARQKDESQWRARAALMAYFIYVCLYVAVIGNMMESGENERFRFATEPMTLIIALMGVRAIGSRLIRRAAARYRAG